MLNSIIMVCSIGLRHTRALAHAPHGMPRRRRDTGIVRAVQCVTVSRKHVFMLVYTYSKRSQKHEAVQRSKHAPRGPLRTDARTAFTRLRHAPINSAEIVLFCLVLFCINVTGNSHVWPRGPCPGTQGGARPALTPPLSWRCDTPPGGIQPTRLQEGSTE